VALIGLKVFPIVIIGGLDSISGAIVGAMIIGVLESLGAGYPRPHTSGGRLRQHRFLSLADRYAGGAAGRTVRPPPYRAGVVAAGPPCYVRDPETNMKPVYSASFAAMIAAAAVTARDAAWSAEKKYGPGVSDSEIKIGQTSPIAGRHRRSARRVTRFRPIIAWSNDRGGINGPQDQFHQAPTTAIARRRQSSRPRRLVEQEQVLAIVGSLGARPTPRSSAI